ncbi:MAG: aldo/keto reductase [Maribacter sp.]|nr:aldo/keto reductase [Maribacter sp.]
MKNSSPYSKIIAGTMTWGSWGKKLATQEMIALMHFCLEQGITTFDHADIYGGYTNEIDFGNAYSASGIDRDHVQLISKCGIQYVCDARENQIKHYDYSKAYIVWSAEESLRKLKTDYLDIFLLHRPSPLMEPEEIAEAISQLMAEGKIKHFGVSNFTPSQIAMLEKVLRVEANQVEFSLSADEVMYDGTLDDSIAHKRMAMSWSPLGSYFKEENERTQRIKMALKPMNEKYGASDDQLLLAWILKHPVKVYPVVGTTTKSRLSDAIKATELEMALEDWFILLEANQGHKVP